MPARGGDIRAIPVESTNGPELLSDILSDPDGPIPLHLLFAARAIDAPVSTISARVSLNACNILCWATNGGRNDSPACEQ